MTTQRFTIKDDGVSPYTAEITVSEDDVQGLLYQYIMNWSKYHYIEEREIDLDNGIFVFDLTRYDEETPLVDLEGLGIIQFTSLLQEENNIIVPIRYILSFMHRMMEADVDTYIDEYFHEGLK